MARRGYSQPGAPREAPIGLRDLDGLEVAPHPFGVPSPPTTPKDPAAEREAKLAQALRANLRRRKAGDRAPAKADGVKSVDQG